MQQKAWKMDTEKHPGLLKLVYGKKKIPAKVGGKPYNQPRAKIKGGEALQSLLFIENISFDGRPTGP